MIWWSDVCFDVSFNVCLGMASLVFPCLVALPTDRNDSDLQSGLCLSVVSTPRHGNTFAFKLRPLFPHFFDAQLYRYIFACMFWCRFWSMFWLTHWCMFWLTYWCMFWLKFWCLFWLKFWCLFWVTFWCLFWFIYDVCFD